MRSVAADRLFRLLDIERKRTIRMVNIEKVTIKRVILICMETFFMGNCPIKETTEKLAGRP
jgi:hypothetical protein